MSISSCLETGLHLSCITGVISVPAPMGEANICQHYSQQRMRITEPTNIALALHNQVLATEGQPPHQVGHPEYTQDLPLKGPPMPILSKTPTPPQAKPATATGCNRNHRGRDIS